MARVAVPAIVKITSSLNSFIFFTFPAIYATPPPPPYEACLSAARTIPSFVTMPRVVVPVLSICFLDSSSILIKRFL